MRTAPDATTIKDARDLEDAYGLVVTEAASLDDDALEQLATDAGHRLEEASAEDVLAWARLTFDSRLVVLASMADGVVANLAGRAAPGVDVGFLDTGLHFVETLGTRDAIAATLPINVISARPAVSLEHQERELGPALWERDPDLCCAIRKVEPLGRLLAPYRAWVTGLRRDESATRAQTPVVAWDPRRRKVKVNPIARWTSADVELYAAQHGIIVNPLKQIGYASIGCWPCTRPVSEGEDERAGRWSGAQKTECGIHL
ncbi:MAG: phosphoadenylyl-sulfate reductase [Nocardioides sp.]|uniref:phosphoadenylyl-sulfate reductase n=1 Tax=Nocardioides sp. TaxID=35761 RepID=UPI0039E54DC6